MTIIQLYGVITMMFVIFEVIMASFSSGQETKLGKSLGWTSFVAGIVTITYYLSIAIKDAFIASVWASAYFVSIDLVLLSLMAFVVTLLGIEEDQKVKRALLALNRYAIVEAVVFVINPFFNISVSFVYRNTAIAFYRYQIHPLYYFHLIYTYGLVVLVVVMLIRRITSIPREYRRQYLYGLVGIVVVVIVNALFLFLPKDSGIRLLDYSIIGYGVVIFLFYWGCFKYSSRGMLNQFKTSIFENIGQGIVLFDYDDNLILTNNRSLQLLPQIDFAQVKHLDRFLNICDITISDEEDDDGYAMQCYVPDGNDIHALRCDYRRLKNDSEQLIGRLFVFSDASLETDLLTGFMQWDSFEKMAAEGEDMFAYPLCVVTCDINGLSLINKTYGHNRGDQTIKELSEILRRQLPKESFFVRGQDANLIVICPHITEEELTSEMEGVVLRFDGTMQFAVSMADGIETEVLKAVETAARGMRQKKLLNKDATHSQMLTSLIRALQQCDSDTESHVKRTQTLGQKLGERIGLNDVEQADLALLCLLHDIGKIGVPLEILNKPSRLTQAEFDILRTHVEKGYQIAISNPELKGIADMILHHHEKWDGTGYPAGLSRESIPLLSRVIAVVDAFDAMVNTRAYRVAMPVTEALSELRRCAGTQFDPVIAAEFIRLIREEEKLDENGDENEAKTPVMNLKFTHLEERKISENVSVHPIRFSKYIVDEDNRVIDADEAFTEMTGYTKEDIEKGLTQGMLIPKSDFKEYIYLVSENAAKQEDLYLEHRLLKKDGNIMYVLCFGRSYYDSVNRANRVEIMIADSLATYSVRMFSANEQEKAKQQLKHWEDTYRKDSLTGLFNHAAFKSEIELKLLENKTKIMFMMFDLDRFKTYNDTYGHRQGDELLTFVAQTIQAALRKEDLACRMGGDEFACALFFKKEQDNRLLYERAQQIANKLNMALGSLERGVGISVGAVVSKSEGDTFDLLYEASDKALYESKEKGRGRLSVFEGER